MFSTNTGFVHIVMVFFSAERLVKILLLVLSLFLFSCSTNIPFLNKDRESLSSKKEQEELAALEAAQGATNSENFVLISSPYVENASAISKEARKDFAEAQKHMQSESWMEAETVLLGMSELYPQLSGIYTNLGIVYQKTGRYEEAEKALNFAIDKNALNFDSYTVLGIVYREQGKFEFAEQTYLKALSYWPHHPASCRNLGILYDLYMGKWSEALEQFRMSQQIAGGGDRELKGWIVDLERRLAENAPKDKLQNSDG